MIVVSAPTITVLLTALLNAVQNAKGATFIFGGEAKRVCEAYKLICPVKKVCALQSIEWPRTMKFPVCVHDTHVVVKSDICRKPPIPGRCQAQFMRWYFNVHMGTCSWFTYSGCGGNQNKFRTAEECERRCMGTKKELLEERKHRRENGTADEMEISSVGENMVDPQGDDLEESREPKLIEAPARAAEMIDLTNDITSSLQLGSNANNVTLTRKEEKKKRRREREKRKRQKNKRNKNKNKNKSHHIKKVEYSTTTESIRQMALLELGSNLTGQHWISTNDTEAPKLAEFKGRQTTFSRFGFPNRDDKPVWMMDKQFRRRGKKYRNKIKEPATKSRSDTLDVYSGAQQDTYYDKVKLFDILTNQAKEQANQV